jgi:PelA/Pel-15E family pectate lyase
MTAVQARRIRRGLFRRSHALLQMMIGGMALTLVALPSLAQSPVSAPPAAAPQEPVNSSPASTTPSPAAPRPRVLFFLRGPVQYLNRSPEWFSSDEAKKIAANILTYQADLGGWPKNIDTTAKPYTGDREKLDPTFDNSATTDELRYLAHMFQATHDEQYQTAISKGVNYILKAQYPNGGWPQFYPPHDHTPYQRYITFNDDAMVRLMQFLREVYSNTLFDFVDADRRQAAHAAFDKGIDCILKCQIKVDGKLTAWCAQHDDIDLSPRPARSYELISLSGGESVGIVRLLMSLDPPSPQVVQAVEGAMTWFEAAKITGIRVDRRPDVNSPRGTNKVVVKDPNAPPIWARFYEIGTNQPIFSDRDGVAKHDLSEIGYERRNGYNWLDYWPAELLSRDYPAWKAKWDPDSSSAVAK